MTFPECLLLQEPDVVVAALPTHHRALTTSLWPSKNSTHSFSPPLPTRNSQRHIEPRTKEAMGNKNSVYFGAPPVRKKAPQHADIQEAWKQIAARVSRGGGKRRVAVVGSGVTGLGAAYHLLTGSAAGEEVEVVVYEASATPGGHAHTELVTEADGKVVGCDTGFMVFNHQNYPNMVELFAELGVEDEDTNMSFAVSMDEGKVEWCSDSAKTLTAPLYRAMIKDMIRFNRTAASLLLAEPGDPKRAWSLREFLEKEGYGPEFTNYYIVPMCAALWSSSAVDVLASSAYAMLTFMDNHCMLQLFNRPQWKTVAGRSQTYVEKIVALLGERLRLNTGVNKVVVMGKGKVEVTDMSYKAEVFDDVIFACHPDQALELLESDQQERLVPYLGQFKYASNVCYLHSDPKLMPRTREAWGSWNYIGSTEGIQGEDNAKPVFVTYWLNQLQNLRTDTPYFVSLNPSFPPDPALVHKVLNESHPQFTPATEEAQRRMTEVQGVDGLWFCGAWMGHGFHEDGLRSGLEVATALTGQKVGWMPPEAEAPVYPMSKAHLYARGFWERCQDGFGRWASGPIRAFLSSSIQEGCLVLRLPGTGDKVYFGDRKAGREGTVVLRVQSWWFFVRVALEYDLGLARAYMAGEFEVEGTGWNSDGLTKLFLLFIRNRDAPMGGGRFAVGALLTSWIGYGLNFLRYRLSMDNSLAGSRHNISAHYDIGNDLYTLMLDEALMMYSSAIYDLELTPIDRDAFLPSSNAHGNGGGGNGRGALVAVDASSSSSSSFPPSPYRMAFKGSLEEAQLRKVDTLISTCRVEKGHTLLDIGFGWGGIAIRAAETIGCKVVGITLSKEQKALAEEKVREKGLEHLIHFELVDYRVFARRHPGAFDRIISCEMIEAVGHSHLGEYFHAVGRLLKPNGVFVMEAITTPESRYVDYLKSTDFINTIVFPGSCCPSLTALMSAMATHSPLSLEGFINIDVHYAETLREWRRRFNRGMNVIKTQGFDDVFVRCWNYYLCYCEAAFESKTEGCLILTFSRPGNTQGLLDNTPCRITTASSIPQSPTTTTMSVGTSPRKEGGKEGGGSGPTTPQRLLQYAREKLTAGSG